MKPLKLSARNLRTWRELDLEVPAGITAIVGPNGAGKSSLVNIIDLALFGSGRELKRALTRAGLEDTVEVGLVFEHGGARYQVRRSWQAKGAGKSRLDLELLTPIDVTAYGDAGPHFIEGEEPEALTRETIAETQERLEEVLGLSRQTFRASSYLAQGDGAAFTEADPRERKAILLDALGVRVWDRLKAQATEMRTEQEHELGAQLATAEQIEGELAQRPAAEGQLAAAEQARAPIELDVVDRERGLEELREEVEQALGVAASRIALETKAKAARQRCSELEERAATLRARQVEADDLVEARGTFELVISHGPAVSRIVEIRALRDARDQELARLEELAEARRETEAHRTKAADDKAAKVAELERRMNGDAPKTCPTCGQELVGGALETAAIRLRRELREAELERDGALEQAVVAAKQGHAFEAELEEANAQMIALLGEERELEKGLPVAMGRDLPKAADAVMKAGLELAQLDDRVRTMTVDADELAKIESHLPSIATEADAAEAELAELAPVDIDKLRTRLALKTSELTGVREHLRNADRFVEKAKAHLERLDLIAGDLAVLRPALEGTKTRVATLKRAEVAFGRDGVPALILEASAIPQLELEANRIVAELGRPYRFELRTQRETQAGTVREALDIIVTTPTGEAAYEDFSGGERTRLDLSLRIALARLLASRRGADVRVLAIDEPAYLDDEGFEQLAKVLRSVAGEFESVLVVSHVDALRDAFDSAIVVAGGADTGDPSRIEEV